MATTPQIPKKPKERQQWRTLFLRQVRQYEANRFGPVPRRVGVLEWMLRTRLRRAILVLSALSLVAATIIVVFVIGPPPHRSHLAPIEHPSPALRP